MPKRPRVPVEQNGQALMRVRVRDAAPRVPEREDEEVDLGPPLPDPHPQLPEVDLRLLAGRGLEAHRGDGGPPPLGPPGLHVPLHLEVPAAEAERLQLPMQHGGIPADLGAAALQKRAEAVEPPPPAPTLRAPAAPRTPPLHGLAVDAQRAGDALHAFPAAEPGHDLPHDVLP